MSSWAPCAAACPPGGPGHSATIVGTADGPPADLFYGLGLPDLTAGPAIFSWWPTRRLPLPPGGRVGPPASSGIRRHRSQPVTALPGGQTAAGEVLGAQLPPLGSFQALVGLWTLQIPKQSDGASELNSQQCFHSLARILIFAISMTASAEIEVFAHSAARSCYGLFQFKAPIIFIRIAAVAYGHRVRSLPSIHAKETGLADKWFATGYFFFFC